MKIRPFAAIAGALVFVFGAGFAAGQQNTRVTDWIKYEKDLRDADIALQLHERNEAVPAAKKVQALIDDSIGDADKTRVLLSQTSAFYYESGKGEAQFKLALLHAAQNERIIELLQRQAAK